MNEVDPFNFPLRICIFPIGLLSTQAQARVWCQCKAKATSTCRLGLKKGFRNCKESGMGKVRTQLGRAIVDHISGWNMCILSWRFRRKSCTTPLECKWPKNVLLLMKAFFTIFGFVTLRVMCSTIYLSIKQNLGYAWLLGPHTLGKLISFNHCSKY